LSACSRPKAAVTTLPKEWPTIVAQASVFGVMAIALFSAAGLAVGNALGGPDPDDRTVLALATATRHPGIAMAIAADMPDKQALLAAMLLVVIVGSVVADPYVKWRTRSHAMEAAARDPPRP